MRKLLTEEEQRILADNSNISSVNASEITYTTAFKQHFINRYLSGVGPKQIFEDAGLPASILGYKRIERAAYHWRRAYECGQLTPSLQCRRYHTPQQTMALLIAEQRSKIEKLERELSGLRDKISARENKNE